VPLGLEEIGGVESLTRRVTGHRLLLCTPRKDLSRTFFNRVKILTTPSLFQNGRVV